MIEAPEVAVDLSPADFGSFFGEVHGYRPFPWQEKLVIRVLEQGWPALIDVPTGLGKTAVLDVAVFVNALRSEHGRRRVFLVVDRRLIVDQAHDQAQKIQRALENPPPGSVCARVRARLALPGDGAPVLDVTRMRGGVDWSWLWIERPDRHAVVTGTVDQVGSRLLFRGYGVGERLRSIDAAMVGTDSLIIIDEAHLSDPFFTTLRDVLAADSANPGRRPVVVAMSASPQNGGSQTHGITGADVQHTVAGPRLRAAKSLHPVTVTASAPTASAAVAGALADWARFLGGPGKAVGVVANTVPMARRVFELLRAGVSDTAERVLLTGRVRPLDREYLLASWLPRIKSGAGRDPEAELYVVATQTIEAGADIDLDAMVTQAASLPALVQRLGRVNRLGNRDEARVVVVHADKLTEPVYGQAAVETWAWLTSLADPVAHKAQRTGQALGAGIDGSPAALRDLTANLPPPQQELMQGTRPYVPVISGPVLNAWARTSPTPQPDVPVAPYLHGIDAGEPTAYLVWRADLPSDDPLAWRPALNRIPPSPDEAVELPVSAVRRWLTALPAAGPSATKPTADPAAGTSVSDLESQQSQDTAEAAVQPPAEWRRVLAYRGAEDSPVITAQQVQPGDFVVVPAAWGGCDRFGWHPGSDLRVTDVADFTGWRGKRRAAIRIGPVLNDAVREYAPQLLEQVGHLISEITDDIAAESVIDDTRYKNRLSDMTAGHSPLLPHEHVLSRLASGGHLLVFEPGMHADLADSQIAGLFVTASVSWNEDQSAAGTSSSTSRQPLTLSGHQAAVGRRARDFARNLGLPYELVLAVERAARHHDEGKRDRRFQVMLHRGDRWQEQIAAAPLAKSGMDPADRAAFRRAATLSGYPRKMRHEALSAQITKAMLEHEPGDGLDTDLVVHLVAAHHGCARPLLPPIVDDHPQKVHVDVGGGQTAAFDTAETVDWAGPERFGRLCERYGYWGLALLESIVRLADIWCSARGEECDDHR